MSKYGHRPGNWFEAIVNMLGGEEAAEKFLRSELIVQPAPTDPWQTTIAHWKRRDKNLLVCDSGTEKVSLYHASGQGEPVQVKPLLISFKADLTYNHLLYLGTDDSSVREAVCHDGKWLDYPD